MKMSKKYTPAIFQPTIRPSWGGILSYISEKEKSDILEAIIKYPDNTGLDSRFWLETIKPDLDEQYQKFVATCEQRGRGAKTYWGEHKLSLSNTYDEHKDNLLKDKDKDKDKVKDKNKDKNNTSIAEYNNSNIKEAIEYWLHYKKEKKQKYTPTGLKDCVHKLTLLSGNDPVLAMQIVKQSTSNGWSGLFPLKNQAPQKESVWQHNMRVMREMEEENNANENLF